MTDEGEVLSALIDREPVDADVLRRVLEVPANRALLVDMVTLRTRVLADDDADMRPLARPISVTPSASLTWSLPRVAAILLLAAGSAGGGMWIERYVSRERPPTPSRMVVMDLVTKSGGDR